jgi:hypothetical protein
MQLEGARWKNLIERSLGNACRLRQYRISG